MRSASLLRPKYSARPRPRRATAHLALALLSLAWLATPAASLALRTNFVARLAAPLAPLGQNDMWTGARASTQPPPDAPLDAEAIEAARVRAHNARAARGLETYTQAVNAWSDLTTAEWKAAVGLGGVLQPAALNVTHLPEPAVALYLPLGHGVHEPAASPAKCPVNCSPARQ